MCLVAIWIQFFGEFIYVCFAPLPILNYVTFCCLIVRTLGWEPRWKSGGSGVEMGHPARYGYSSLAVPPAMVVSPAPAPTGQPLLLEQLCGVSTLPLTLSLRWWGLLAMAKSGISFGFCIFPLLIWLTHIKFCWHVFRLVSEMRMLISPVWGALGSFLGRGLWVETWWFSRIFF